MQRRREIRQRRREICQDIYIEGLCFSTTVFPISVPANCNNPSLNMGRVPTEEKYDPPHWC